MLKKDKSVLVVEDDDGIRLVICRLLKYRGYAVAEARNGREGLDTLISLVKEGVVPDVIVLDLMMPVMNGWEFLREKERQDNLSEIPVIILTGANIDNKSVFHTEVLDKATDLSHLYQSVERHSKKNPLGFENAYH